MKRRYLLSLIVVVLVIAISLSVDARRRRKKEEPAEPQVQKTIVVGNVDIGYMVSGAKPADMKETIQFNLKKEIEKKGKGRYIVKIADPAVQADYETTMPAMPTNRAPTSAELSKYISSMKQWQQQANSPKKRYKPVAADAFFDFRLKTAKSGMDTGGLMGTIGDFTGTYTSAGDLSTKSEKVHLVCDMRDPKTGALLDRYIAKASSVKVRNIAGYTSYDYGSDELRDDYLFKSATKKCAKWISSKVK